MDYILILDGIALIVFLIITFIICLLAIICSIGWMYESSKRTSLEERNQALLDEIRVSEACGRFKSDYTEYMRELEARVNKERKNVQVH